MLAVKERQVIMFKLNLANHLPHELKEKIARERAEVIRLYGLTNEWLAHALLKIARQAQVSSPEYGLEHSPTYNSRLIWGIIPELARRLGTVKLKVEEIDWEIRELSDYELRIRIGNTLQNIGVVTSKGWDLLGRETVHGNPVAIGIDRLCPGDLNDHYDTIVRRALELSRYRKKSYRGVWTPEFVA